MMSITTCGTLHSGFATIRKLTDYVNYQQGIRRIPMKKTCDNAKMKYAYRVRMMVVEKFPVMAGRMPWDDVTYLYNQGVSVENCADKIMDAFVNKSPKS
jgi:hypothetical protein